MAIASERVRLWGVLAATLIVQFAAMAVFAEHSAYDILLQYLETQQQREATIVGVLLGGVALARYGYGRRSLAIQSLGTAGIIIGYAFALQYLVRVGITDRPFVAIEVVGVTTFLVLTALFWYAVASPQQFRTWDARAVVVFISAVLMAIAGLYVEPFLVGAYLVGFFPMMMHMCHVMGTIQSVTVQPLRHGLRLYAAVFAFYVDLTLYMFRALRRFR